MGQGPYFRVDKDKLILRDHLAADRTVLANERTFLAYIRTALTLFVSGATFVRFFDTLVLDIIGWIFIPAGILTFVIGTLHYGKMKGMLRVLRE